MQGDLDMDLQVHVMDVGEIASCNCFRGDKYALWNGGTGILEVKEGEEKFTPDKDEPGHVRVVVPLYDLDRFVAIELFMAMAALPREYEGAAMFVKDAETRHPRVGVCFGLNPVPRVWKTGSYENPMGLLDKRLVKTEKLLDYRNDPPTPDGVLVQAILENQYAIMRRLGGERKSDNGG